jgi:hypothetical protein
MDITENKENRLLKEDILYEIKELNKNTKTIKNILMFYFVVTLLGAFVFFITVMNSSIPIW